MTCGWFSGRSPPWSPPLPDVLEAPGVSIIMVPSWPAEVGTRIVTGVEIGDGPVYCLTIVLKWLSPLGGIVIAPPGF
jgi:hypothetical protein